MPNDMQSVFKRLDQLKELPELQTAVVDFFRDNKVTQPEAMLNVIDQFVAGDVPAIIPGASEPPRVETRKPTYYAPEALPPLTAPTFPEVPQAAALMPAPEAPQLDAAPGIAGQHPQTAAMSADEIANVASIINQYSGYPGIQSAFTSIATALASDPKRLSDLMRELVDQIEQVRSNPHVHHPVNAEIAQAVEQIRQVELEKPDPLNLLRPPEEVPPPPPPPPEAERPLTITDIFLATVSTRPAAALIERAVEQQQQQQPVSFAPFDMGSNTAALADGIPAQSVPDGRAPGPDLGFRLV